MLGARVETQNCTRSTFSENIFQFPKLQSSRCGKYRKPISIRVSASAAFCRHCFGYCNLRHSHCTTNYFYLIKHSEALLKLLVFVLPKFPFHMQEKSGISLANASILSYGFHWTTEKKRNRFGVKVLKTRITYTLLLCMGWHSSACIRCKNVLWKHLKLIKWFEIKKESVGAWWYLQSSDEQQRTAL